MNGNEAKHLQELIRAKKDRLRQLEINGATYGLDVPPHISVESEKLRGEIGDLQTQLATLEKERKGGLEMNRKESVAIIVAVLALIGTALTAYFGYKGVIEPAKLSIKATQTAEARLTLMPTDTPVPPTDTPTPMPPTDTPTPVPPTETSRPTPAPTETSRPTSTPSCPTVSGPFAAAWNSAQGNIGCVSSYAITGSIAEENFEGGKMFWREPIDYAQVLVLFNDGTWQIVKHSPFIEGSPDFSCPDAHTPSQCPPTPKRGFGMVWCDTPAIRSRLGNATDCERGYQGSMQEFERGFMLQTDSGAIYVFYDDGRWERR